MLRYTLGIDTLQVVDATFVNRETSFAPNRTKS